MRSLNLSTVPSQSFSVRLDDIRWVLRFKEAAGIMAVDIEKDGETILTGSRVLAGEPLIPFRRLEAGNFVLLTLNDALPDWRQFGNTQTLVYLTAAETEAIRNG